MLCNLPRMGTTPQLAGHGRMHAEPRGWASARRDAGLVGMLSVDVTQRPMSYEIRLLSNLRQRIIADINDKHTELGSGALVVADDAVASGMRFTRHVGTIAGLKAALSHIQEVEDEMSGKVKVKKGDDR